MRFPHLASAASLFCAALALPSIALAEWPDDRPIQVLVGFAAGGATDTMARAMAPVIARHLGPRANLIVVNKPGAASEISNLSLMNARKDGYTIGVVNLPAMAFSPLYRKTSFDPAALTLVARVMSDPTILVAKQDSPYATLKDVVSALKAHPSSLSFGHNGVGTNGHLALMQLASSAGVKMNEIPFNGTAQSKTALFGGHIDFAAITVSELREAGKEAVPLKVLAQMADQRSPALPKIPTANEQGFNDVMPAERGFAVPRGTPPDIGERLQAAIAATMQDPEYLKRAGEDAPALAYLPGAAWTQAIAGRAEMMRKLAAAMPKE